MGLSCCGRPVRPVYVASALQDMQYAWRLVSKAAFSNYTLRAWEVRTLQRTVKDLLTLRPGDVKALKAP